MKIKSSIIIALVIIGLIGVVSWTWMSADSGRQKLNEQEMSSSTNTIESQELETEKGSSITTTPTQKTQMGTPGPYRILGLLMEIKGVNGESSADEKILTVKVLENVIGNVGKELIIISTHGCRTGGLIPGRSYVFSGVHFDQTNNYFTCDYTQATAFGGDQ